MNLKLGMEFYAIEKEKYTASIVTHVTWNGPYLFYGV